MRRKDPLIIGAGPAGCAAAITLAHHGARPLLLERSRETGDALCGGFISWRTRARLESLGLTVPGHVITRLRLFARGKQVEALLPEPGLGLSRHSMDSALAAAAVRAGAGLERGVTVRDIGALKADHEALFLATGKHDLKGWERPRLDPDPAIGLRIRLPASPLSAQHIGDAIELHLFHKGYAGVELQEDGSANICLAVRKSLLSNADKDPHQLLEQLGADHPHFGARLTGLSRALRVDAIANVPYGWRQVTNPEGVYRLGDQCAVIPSLAGEGNGIALASGVSAALAWLGGQDAQHWQARFARQTAWPVGLAKSAWRVGETPWGAAFALPLLRRFPALAGWIASQTRITP